MPLALAPLVDRDAPRSPFWWTTPLLLGLYLALWLLRARLPRLRPARASTTAAVYLLLGLAAGATYELSITVDGTGVGGFHRDTATSFALLPGFLVPAVLLTWFMTRRFALRPAQTFFVGGVLTWYESVTVGVSYLLSAPWVAPVLVAFYVASYAVYTGALGALVVDHRLLWAPSARPIGTVRLLLLAAAGGVVCWACFAVWSALVL
jgi:hypothetical protein